MNIADIHTHILFGVDDGAKTLQDSLSLIEMAYESGTRQLFFTPHSERAAFDYEKTNDSLEKLMPLIKDKFPGLRFYSGCEILFSMSILEAVQSGDIPTLANSRYILLEFMPMVFFSQILSAVNASVSSGFIPIIAHAERYACLKQKEITRLIEAGALIQLNARSVLGKNGFSVKRFCKSLLKKNQVHFIASDSHDINIRHSRLGECAQYVIKKFGQQTAEKIFNINPSQIINNKPI